jgi:cytochrome c oxidase subunit II
VSVSASSPSPGAEPRHGVRIAIIWAVFTVIAVPLMIWVAGPHIPPFNGSLQSHDQHQVNVTLLALATPVAGMIWVYFGYAAVVFRQQGAELVDGPPITGNARIQTIWLSVTTVLVLGLATFGTVDLLGSSHGAGGGQGPNPLTKPASGTKILQIQVIGQQWLWTFRYPQYGGVETPILALPENEWVAFHVTSLDVVHSFWAYQLGVKADAVPGSDNIAYVKALKTQEFVVRCAELCGLWHGHMTAEGQVMTQSGFNTWIGQMQTKYKGVTKYLPPYAPYYYPQPLRLG